MADNLPASASPNSGEFILFQSEDGSTRIEVRFAGETVWLSINQIAELFQRDKAVISRHISNLFEEVELQRESVVAVFATTAADRKTYQVEYYNLDVIISVGYRVRSHRGTQFRIWATERLREYLIKGFAMDDDRLKRAGGGNYFEELLARIRDIRSSERVFWRTVLDIYATSIDYDPSSEASQLFFKTVRNKMHWAVHGQTAAEVLHRRADAGQPHMGLTSWAGNRPRKTDVNIAKNYLNADELNVLNRIVTAYLEFAEVQALNRRPMYMADWIEKLDDFLRLSDRDILTQAGKISHEDAVGKAEAEFDQYRRVQAELPQPVDEHFEETLDELKKIGGQVKEPKTSPSRPTPASSLGAFHGIPNSRGLWSRQVQSSNWCTVRG